MKATTTGRRPTQYLYWLPEGDFERAKAHLTASGVRMTRASYTPCQVLKAAGDGVTYAAPSVWSGSCRRQGSWYRESSRAGQYMLVSARRLPAMFDRFLDAELAESDFQPDALPDERQLAELVAAPEYQTSKPREWEQVGRGDSIVFKLLFTLTRFWGRGDSLRKHWLGHRANHANFLARRFTTEVDGEDVPYSVTDNAGVCSSCVEMFNLIERDSRKLVRACPGSVIFGGAPRHTYLDVRPTRPAAPPRPRPSAVQRGQDPSDSGYTGRPGRADTAPVRR
ncbi:MAG TPA: hypothetical protein VFG47_17790 [Geminicoccaceae bacterium]|nr:hypothetical protein [Geminicoccaceae bacterium]